MDVDMLAGARHRHMLAGARHTHMLAGARHTHDVVDVDVLAGATT